MVDHKNGNALDNRWENLRIASNSQNQANSRICRSNRSGFKGVSFNKAANKWVATIQHGGELIYIGGFGSAQEAHMAYQSTQTQLHGDYARRV